MNKDTIFFLESLDRWKVMGVLSAP